MKKINIVITSCGERETLRLLNQIKIQWVEEFFNLYILLDSEKVTPEYIKMMRTIMDKYFVQGDNVLLHALNGDFASHKNYPHKFMEEDSYVIQLDADEEIGDDFFANMLEILRNNPSVELINLARENYVRGLTPNHISKWGWTVDNKNRINFPDFQSRVYKLVEGVEWVGKVHERIIGAKTMASLTLKETMLYHYKSIQKQEKQNEFYSRI